MRYHDTASVLFLKNIYVVSMFVSCLKEKSESSIHCMSPNSFLSIFVTDDLLGLDFQLKTICACQASEYSTGYKSTLLIVFRFIEIRIQYFTNCGV